ncbi:MAG: helix-turn-helix domain-containing protein [Candidatus Gastranaerophilaceae bacterium]|jgi:DNA-binding Xre family transcriptional regulator
MSISNDIKKLLIDKDITLTQLAKIISEKKGKNFSIQNLSQKLKNETINLRELEIILDALNYKICYLPQKPFK